MLYIYALDRHMSDRLTPDTVMHDTTHAHMHGRWTFVDIVRLGPVKALIADAVQGLLPRLNSVLYESRLTDTRLFE